ncbi:hypothetical protein ACPRNU_10775 [Chromobacterium vaccinii]|nr:hypothetical protein [Chromobacterium sp. ATCC 53434]
MTNEKQLAQEQDIQDFLGMKVLTPAEEADVSGGKVTVTVTVTVTVSE